MKVIFEILQFAKTVTPSLINRGSTALLLSGCLIAATQDAHSQALSFSTLAGYAGQGASNGPVVRAQFKSPRSVAVDASGNVYVADTDNHTIRKITSAGVVSTFAGYPGVHGSVDSSGTNALFFRPSGIAVDNSGNVFVADTGNHTIRQITPDGTVSTFAGSPGNPGSFNNVGTNALFFRPSGIAVDNSGNVFVADTGNNTIRQITSLGVVTTLAGSAGNYGSTDASGTSARFSGPQGITLGASGTLYVTDTGNGTIRKITSAGVVTTLAGSAGNYGSTNGTGTNALFYSPQGIVAGPLGNLYIADTGNSTIRKVTTAGVVTTFAGSATNFGSANGQDLNARFWNPAGIAIDASTNLFVADLGNNLVRKINSTGFVSTLAGSPSLGSTDGATTDARFAFPQAVTMDVSTNIYVADTANHTIRKITPAGFVTTLAGSAGNPGSTNGTGVNASFYGPQGAAADNSGNIYVADTVNHVIRKITPAGIVSTFAGSVGVPGTANGATTNAQFNAPQSLAVDGVGNVFVADTFNNLIRKITPAGVVTTLAGSFENFGSSDGTNSNARFYWPAGIAVDNSGSLFVADYFNHTVRKLAPAGTNWVVSTLAGVAGFWGNVDGTNSTARFFGPRGISVDNSGAVYVSDSGNQTIRKLTPSGTNWIVTTVAGLAGTAGSADGVTTNAQFNFPSGLTFGAGLLYVADADNNSIRFDGVLTNLLADDLVVLPQFTSAFISWNTPTPSTSQVLYGLTPAYGIRSSLDSSLHTNHTVLLTGLATNTLYYFKVVSTSPVNQFTATNSFATLSNSIIVDAPHATFSGVWTLTTAAQDKYSSYYQYAASSPSSDSAQATFRPNIVSGANYDVYIWSPAGTNCSTQVPVIVSSSSGDSNLTLDQTINGGKWQLLTANKYFAPGLDGSVQLGNNTGESGRSVMADAVQWVYNPNQDTSTDGSVPPWWANFYLGANDVNGTSFALNGRTLYENYLIGLNPTDPDAQLNFRINPAGSGLQLTFSPWQGGRSYQLLGATNLDNPVWTVIPGLPVTQNIYGEGVINYTNPAGAKTFYRLLISPTP